MHDMVQKRVSPKYDSKTIKNYQRIRKEFSNLNILSLKFIIERSTTEEIIHETEDLKKLYSVAQEDKEMENIKEAKKHGGQNEIG